MQSLRAWVALLMCCAAIPSYAHAQSQAAQPIGSITAAGEVYVNETLAPTSQTLFAGDTVRTGAEGTAAVLATSRGTLTIGSLARVSFPAAPRFFAVLEQGAVGMRAQAGASAFQIRIGDFLVAPVPGVDAVVGIERAADGSATVACELGSVGVIHLEGPQTVFLRGGQTVQITAGGVLQQQTPAPQQTSTPPSQPQPPPKAGGKKNKTPLMLILLGAGAGGAAAVALGRGGAESSPVSPSVP